MYTDIAFHLSRFMSKVTKKMSTIRYLNFVECSQQIQQPLLFMLVEGG